MNCSQSREVLADLDRPAVLSPELREEALAHAEICAECGQLLTETESLDAELRRLAAQAASAQASERLEAQLLGALRERNANRAHWAARRYAAAIGIAAMLLVAFGFWIYRRSGTAVLSPTRDIAGESGAAQRKVIARPEPQTGGPAVASASRPNNALPSDEQQVAEAENSETFTPLPDAEYPEALDDAAVVRVVMPRAALASFGLPLEAMEGDGTVRADLIVSADGTPQAIRLLSQEDSNAALRR
jgi:hypothetical protein